MAKTMKARKLCKFCAAKTKFIDFKNMRILRRYINLNGKIQPRRYSGNCLKHQRMLVSAIKKARIVALVPFIRDAVV
ncbi:MAG: 30S ribosomal protein S18 [Patescibacteria group bacterium]